MQRTNFTQFDELPEAMVTYMKHYGPHFNRKLYEFAVSKMYKENNNKREKINPYSKEQIKNILKLELVMKYMMVRIILLLSLLMNTFLMNLMLNYLMVI
jgi:CRISPR/Cas system CSM-associated protein Csm2 small subunit